MKPLVLHIFIFLSILVAGLVLCSLGSFFVWIAYNDLRSGSAPTRAGFFQSPLRSYRDVRSASPFQFWINVLSHFVIGILFVAFGACVIFYPSFFK